MKEDSKLITVAEFENDFEAKLAKTILEDAGIEAVILGQDLESNMFPFPIARSEVQVFEKDAERAQSILSQKHDKDFKDIGMEETD